MNKPNPYQNLSYAFPDRYLEKQEAMEMVKHGEGKFEEFLTITGLEGFEKGRGGARVKRRVFRLWELQKAIELHTNWHRDHYLR